MKAYIQYLDYDLAGNLSEPCGDRSIVVLDGRQSTTQWIQDGFTWNGFRRKHYPAFRIMKGNLMESYCIYEWIE